jgi:hypothetical protein
MRGRRHRLIVVTGWGRHGGGRAPIRRAVERHLQAERR